jgi:hypothetical protein
MPITVGKKKHAEWMELSNAKYVLLATYECSMGVPISVRMSRMCCRPLGRSRAWRTNLVAPAWRCGQGWWGRDGCVWRLKCLRRSITHGRIW